MHHKNCLDLRDIKAIAQAHAAALARKESRLYEAMVNGGRTAYLSVPHLQGLLEGGVPILRGGQCPGALGGSGVKAAEDAEVAGEGMGALGD